MWSLFHKCIFIILSLYLINSVDGFLQADEAPYITNFQQLISKSYSQPLPAGLLSSTCKQSITFNSGETVTLPSGTVNAAQAQSLCGTGSTCVVSPSTTLTMDGSLVVGALLNYGTVIWTDTTQTSSSQWLCAGYVVTSGGTFTLNLEDYTKTAVIYIKNNGAVHPGLRSRVFGGLNASTVTVTGSPKTRTWSLLSRPVSQGATSIALMHDATAMGWHVGDRILIASTKFESTGTSDAFNIASINGNIINLASAFPTNSPSTTQSFTASQSVIETAWIVQQNAEVMDMTRNVLITGDDFQHKPCVGPIAIQGYPGGIDAASDCSCINPAQASYFRTQCTLGLHTVVAGKGSTLNMQYTRVEKCGQRGILAKYCIHLHQIGNCPNCIIRGNSVEYGHQRGITIHSSSSALVSENVISDVRGANIYIEDGNEMFNQIRHNVVLCPWPKKDPLMAGCTVPGTDEDQADTDLNQSGIWAVSFTNDVIGNRFASTWNGMLYQSQSFEHGRHSITGLECTINQQMGRLEGNTFHSNGRFGTYFLADVYPKKIDRTIANNGLVPAPTIDGNGDPYWPSCAGYDSNGMDRGVMYQIVRNVDYGNGFAGQYNLGDIQYRQHAAIGTEQSLYWKEIKNPADGCSPAVINYYAYGYPNIGYGNIGLPGGHGTMVLENFVMAGWITLESSHHCGLGLTGLLCMPTYVFVNPDTTGITSFQYVWGANNGAMWNLAPGDTNPTGQMFPAGWISLANPYWTYLLAIDGGKTCISSSDPSITTPAMSTYNDGILCKRPLRRLEVFTPALTSSMNPPRLRLELWQNNQMISYQLVPFWQIDQGQTGKNGYGMTVIPGLDHSYRLMREDLGPLDPNWVIEFSDPIFGNRWARDEIYLQVTGRTCPSIVHSLHDRLFIWYDSDNHPFTPGHGACTTKPDMTPVNCAAVAPPATGLSCPEKCPGGCNNGYCDCGRGVCQCEAGFSGPNCANDVCASAGCDPFGGRCATRYLGGTLQPVEAMCVCRDGAYGPKCSVNPCSAQTCSGHGTCQALSQTSIKCTCADGWGGNHCQSPCAGAINGYRTYANSGIQNQIYSRAPASSGTNCRDQCSADSTCVAASFYNNNYCALMSSLSGITLPPSTNTMLQASAATIVLFVKCLVPNDTPLVASSGGFTSQPTPIPPTAAPTTIPITNVTTTTGKPTISISTPTPAGTTSAPTTIVSSPGPGACVNGFITYQGKTYDLMGLPYTPTSTAAACQALCAAMDPTSCAAAVWYNMNACVRYTAAQAQGKTLSPSPDPALPRTTFVRCTVTATQPPTQVVPGTQAPTTQAPGTKAPGTQAPTTQSPVTGTTAPTSKPTTPITSDGPPCINGFQMYADTTWDLMGLPWVGAYTAQACQDACNALGSACAAAVWFNFNACVRYTQAQTVGQVMTKSPDPALPRTLIVRCTATTTAAPTPVPATQAPATKAPVTQAPGTQAPTTQAPGTQAPATQSPATQSPVTTTTAPTSKPTTTPITSDGPPCINGFQMYADTTWDLMGLTYVGAYTAQACQDACNALGTACAAAVWYNFNACVRYTQAQTVGQVMRKSPDPALPRTLIVRCTATTTTAAPTPVPATQAPATKAPATQAPATQAPATKAPATQAPGTQAPVTQAPVVTPSPTTVPGQPECISGFQTYTDSTYDDLGGLPYTVEYTAHDCLQLCASKDATTCAGAVWYNFNACVLFNSKQVIGKNIVRSPDPNLPRTTFVRCGTGSHLPGTPAPSPCSNIICTIPTCRGTNATLVMEQAANPTEGTCCDLYSCQIMVGGSSLHGAASTLDSGAVLDAETSTTPLTGVESTSSKRSLFSSQIAIISTSISIGVVLTIAALLIWRHVKQRSSKVSGTYTPRIIVPSDDMTEHEKESRDVVTDMIPFHSPVTSELNRSPSPASSMSGISPILRGLAGSPPPSLPAAQHTPLSSISLDSPSPHTGTMSHRHPLRPSTSATSLLSVDPRVQVINPRQIPFQHQQEQHQP